MSAHKFVWSTPVNTYTLAAVCEYCGLVAHHGNRFADSPEHQEAQARAQKPCPNAPSVAVDRSTKEKS